MAAERGYWSSLTSLQKAAVLLGVPAGATVLYILYRRYRESREERATFVGEEELELEVRVPRAALKSIIGRKGANIRQLRQETGARLHVESDEEGEEAALLIAGSPGQVCRAKAAVHRILTQSAPVSEQLCVPRRAVGRIIGRGGETVKGICRSSGARVVCEREADAGPAPVRMIELSGTRHEVAVAKKLIMEKVAEDEASWKEVVTRCQRKQPLGSRWVPEPLTKTAPELLTGMAPEPQEEEEEDGDFSWGDSSLLDTAPSEGLEDDNQEPPEPPPVPKFEVPSPDFSFPAAEHLEVYVSAAQSPARFWVQLVGQRSQQLAKLSAEMRHYYGSTGTTAELSAVRTGDIVAAPYGAGGDWHRACIRGALENGCFHLHYVDFGGDGEAPGAALRALRSDFLSLPFQAIECSLAGVAPAGPRWSEAAREAFERLCHCAHQQPLRATISSYVPAGLGARPHVWLLGSHHGQ
ncbi:tudor and KH domain-containing protein, partial [Aegotheles albertisi]